MGLVDQAVVPALPMPPAVGTEADASPAGVGSTGGGAGGSASFAGVLSGALGSQPNLAADANSDATADPGTGPAQPAAPGTGRPGRADTTADGTDGGVSAAATALAGAAALVAPITAAPPAAPATAAGPTAPADPTAPTSGPAGVSSADAVVRTEAATAGTEAAGTEAAGTEAAGTEAAGAAAAAADGSAMAPARADAHRDDGPPAVGIDRATTADGPMSGSSDPALAPGLTGAHPTTHAPLPEHPTGAHARPHLDDGPPAVVSTPTVPAGGPSSGFVHGAPAPAAADSLAVGGQAAAGVAPAPVATVQPTSSAQAVTAAAPFTLDVPQPALSSALGRLRSHGDGTHELTVALHPAELGSVGVTATVRDGAITVTVACAQNGAHAAVDAALPSLRHELAQAGFTAVDVNVSGGGRDGAAPAREQFASPDSAANVDDIAERPARRLARDTALDRLL